MNQQISVEAALDAFRREYGQTADANVLLKARVAELEAEVAQLRGTAPDPQAAGSGLLHEVATAQR